MHTLIYTHIHTYAHQWPSETKLKKLALLGMCGDAGEYVSDNGLHKLFLSSLLPQVKRKEGKRRRAQVCN
jgi:hypothetical protein